MALSAPPAEAAFATFVAYGQGVASCTIYIEKTFKSRFYFGGAYEQVGFSGSTSCSAPIQQSGHAFIPGDALLDGGLCSGFTTSCSSGADFDRYEGNAGEGAMQYHVTLIASREQSWFGAPVACEGVGSHRLDCVFSVGTYTGNGL